MFTLFEKWLNSDVPMAGEVFREIVVKVFRANELVRAGLEVGGITVKLNKIICPLLNVVGEYDDVVPPDAALPLTELTGSRDRKTLLFPTGHVGAAVSSGAHHQMWRRSASG